MAILIDGYNLLNSTGITGHGHGPGHFERSRRALLHFLVTVLEPEESLATTVVFDAQQPPAGLPRTTRHGPITVRYSSEFRDADALLELLIRADTAPRRLVVVSSDHRIQRAAHRRRATAVDSAVWYGEMLARWKMREAMHAKARRVWKPRIPLSPDEIHVWLERFGGEGSLAQMIAEAEAILRRESTVGRSRRFLRPRFGNLKRASNETPPPDTVAPSGETQRRKQTKGRRGRRRPTDVSERADALPRDAYGPFPADYIERIVQELRDNMLDDMERGPWKPPG